MSCTFKEILEHNFVYLFKNFFLFFFIYITGIHPSPSNTVRLSVKWRAIQKTQLEKIEKLLLMISMFNIIRIDITQHEFMSIKKNFPLDRFSSHFCITTYLLLWPQWTIYLRIAKCAKLLLLSIVLRTNR